MKRVLIILCLILIVGIILEASFAIWIKSENTNIYVAIDIEESNASAKYQMFVPLYSSQLGANEERSAYVKIAGRFDPQNDWYVLDDPNFNLNAIVACGFVGLSDHLVVDRLKILSEKELCIVREEYCNLCLENNVNLRRVVCDVCGGKGRGEYDYQNDTWTDGLDCTQCGGTGLTSCSCCVFKTLPVTRAMVDVQYKDYYVKQSEIINYIYIPANITEIDAGMFFNMTKLTSLVFEQGSKSLVMRSQCFGSCVLLKAPTSIAMVGRPGTYVLSDVFAGCA